MKAVAVNNKRGIGLRYFQKNQSIIKYILLLCFLSIALLTIGCAQDPLASLPKSVKDRLNALSNVEFKKKDLDTQIDEVSSTFGRILADDFWKASPEEEFEMILTAKVFLDEDQFDDFDVELEDPLFADEYYSLTQIPDDTENKNERKYLFKWIPSENFLSDHFEKCVPITFKLQTSGDFALERIDTFTLFVTNKSQLPVLQVVDMFREIQEDNEGIMRVHVFDPQATEINPPVLILDEVEFSEDAQMREEEKPRDLNQLLHFMQREKIDENIWEFQYRLTSNVLDPGADSKAYALEMFAASVSGISDTHQITLNVFNRVLIPTVIGPSSVKLYAGKTSSVFIQVLDPLASGNLSSKLLTAKEDLPGEVVFDYDTTTEGILVSLSLSIPENVDVSQKYTAAIEISNEGIENFQKVLESVVHTVSIDIAK